MFALQKDISNFSTPDETSRSDIWAADKCSSNFRSQIVLMQRRAPESVPPVPRLTSTSHFQSTVSEEQPGWKRRAEVA